MSIDQYQNSGSSKKGDILYAEFKNIVVFDKNSAKEIS